ncbi:TRAP transporter substrate-binding protein [Pelagibius sp.]|uniref:TRAP transporter substrate-binding protein n=1 Tax=Pelagibius sp. TaxID=1931238 RepID=UPI00260D906E|nr:TRAP transporter substrate-binding protein [Pelagibius sp.]
MTLTRRTFNKGLGGLGLVTALAGVGAPALAARTLIYGNAGNIDSASNRFAKKWLDLVTERTGGELKFDIKAGTIGGGKDVLDGTALGTVQLYNGAYTGLREFDVFYAPYFARDSNHAQKIANDLLFDELNAAVQKRYPSLRYLSVARAGPWKLFTNQKLETFDDLKGLKIRAPEIEGVIAGLEQVGAKPTVIPFNELYGALQQGVVDGMATLGNLMISQKFYEVVKYCYQNDWGIGLDKQMINLGTWNGLSQEQQDILTGTFNELEPQDFFRATEEAEIANFRQWREFNGEDTTPLLDASAAQKTLEPAIKALADDIFGAGAYDKIQAL